MAYGSLDEEMAKVREYYNLHVERELSRRLPEYFVPWRPGGSSTFDLLREVIYTDEHHHAFCENVDALISIVTGEAAYETRDFRQWYRANDTQSRRARKVLAELLISSRDWENGWEGAPRKYLVEMSAQLVETLASLIPDLEIWHSPRADLIILVEACENSPMEAERVGPILESLCDVVERSISHQMDARVNNWAVWNYWGPVLDGYRTYAPGAYERFAELEKEIMATAV